MAYGGGDLTLTGTANSWSVNLNIGEWLMLGWMVNDVPPTTTGGSYSTRPYFRWYRIVAASPPVLSGSSWTRSVTVNGADINLVSLVPLSGSAQAMAFIYDGAVGVYERPVRLEGPSLWSN